MEEMRHLGAYGLIIKDNQIALIRKSRGAYKGKLDVPGGTIEHGEKVEETLVREIKEELDAVVKDYELFDVNSVVVDWNYEGRDINMHHIGIFYKVSLVDYKLKSDGDGLDSLGAKWYKIDELKEEEVSPLVWIELDKIKRL